MAKKMFDYIKGKEEDEIATIGNLAQQYRGGLEWPLAMQFLLQVNVLPVGTCIEIYGPKGTAKSSLALSLSRQSIDSGGYAIYLDSENKAPDDQAEYYVVGREGFIHKPINGIAQTANTAYEYLNKIEKGEQKLKKKGADKDIKHGLLIIDSLVTGWGENEESRIEKDGYDSNGAYAPYATIWTPFFRQVQTKIKNLNCTVLAINQFRDNINSYGGGGHSPGGQAKDHALSFALEMGPKGEVNHEKIIEAYQELRVKVKKNSCGPSGRSIGQQRNSITQETIKFRWHSVNNTFDFDFSDPLCGVLTKLLKKGTGIKGFGPLMDLTKYGGTFSSESLGFEDYSAKQVEEIVENNPEIKKAFQDKLGINRRPVFGSKVEIPEDSKKGDPEGSSGEDEKEDGFKCEHCDRDPYKREGDLVNHIKKTHPEKI